MSTEVPPPPPPSDSTGGAPQPPKLKLQPRVGVPTPPPAAPLPPPPAAGSIPRPAAAPAAPRPAALSPTMGATQPADAGWLVAVDVVAALGSVGCAVFLALELFSKTQA